MKKLFISCPMRGRTEANIKKSMKKMHKIAEIIFDQKLEVIPTYYLSHEHIPPETKNKSIWCLSESIKKLAEADYFIGVRFADCFKGCDVETKVAQEYGITRTYVDARELMPDIFESKGCQEQERSREKLENVTE